MNAPLAVAAGACAAAAGLWLWHNERAWRRHMDAVTFVRDATEAAHNQWVRDLRDRHAADQLEAALTRRHGPVDFDGTEWEDIQ